MEPSGDVTITLRNPNKALTLYTEGPSELGDANDKTEDSTGENSTGKPDLPTLPTSSGDFLRALEASKESEGKSASEIEPSTFPLSSHYLSLASPVFKAMLTGRWTEGQKDQQSGKLLVGAEGWDGKAFTIAINVLHSRFQQIPRRTDEEYDDLAKVQYTHISNGMHWTRT